MGGNYQKDLYKQLMEIMERCDSLENNLISSEGGSVHSRDTDSEGAFIRGTEPKVEDIFRTGLSEGSP